MMKGGIQYPIHHCFWIGEKMNRRSTFWKTWITVTVVVLLSALVLTACGGEQPASQEVARPSNAGGPGEAINLTGNATAGATVFTENCVACHGDQGKGGIPNPGTDDGTVPELNPIDPTLVSSDAKTFATNLDLFIEHGSKPEGDSPTLEMKAFGDEKLLTPQQIADVIAYVISLNK
jgi:mono/diheme cytochrome c family protein